MLAIIAALQIHSPYKSAAISNDTNRDDSNGFKEVHETRAIKPTAYHYLVSVFTLLTNHHSICSNTGKYRTVWK